jgi:hypothetical protein
MISINIIQTDYNWPTLTQQHFRSMQLDWVGAFRQHLYYLGVLWGKARVCSEVWAVQRVREMSLLIIQEMLQQLKRAMLSNTRPALIR